MDKLEDMPDSDKSSNVMKITNRNGWKKSQSKSPSPVTKELEKYQKKAMIMAILDEDGDGEGHEDN